MIYIGASSICQLLFHSVSAASTSTMCQVRLLYFDYFEVIKIQTSWSWWIFLWKQEWIGQSTVFVRAWTNKIKRLMGVFTWKKRPLFDRSHNIYYSIFSVTIFCNMLFIQLRSALKGYIRANLVFIPRIKNRNQDLYSLLLILLTHYNYFLNINRFVTNHGDCNMLTSSSLHE